MTYDDDHDSDEDLVGVLPLDESMEANSPANKGLLPIRHPNHDLFICDVLDAVPKDDLASMEHPVFSLSTKPDHQTRHYEHNGQVINIIPSGKGMATIHDKDILIYCISQLIAKMNRGEAPGRTLRLRANELLIATNRQRSGQGYKLLGDALTRLRGTTVQTNIKTGGVETNTVFGLLEEAKVSRHTFDGRMIDIEVTLSDWVYRSVLGKNVLTISRDYFRLRKPFERRVYEIARKHCGMSKSWKIDLKLLYKKCGVQSALRVFKYRMKRLCDHDKEYSHFPDYSISMDDDFVYFVNRFLERRDLEERSQSPDGRPIVDPEVMNDAKIIAPGYDVYALYEEWVAWWKDMGGPKIQDPDKAFLGFCRRRNERKPMR